IYIESCSRRFYPKRLTYVRLTMYTHFTFTLMAHCTSGAIRGSTGNRTSNDFSTSCTTVAPDRTHTHSALHTTSNNQHYTQPHTISTTHNLTPSALHTTSHNNHTISTTHNLTQKTYNQHHTLHTTSHTHTH